MQATSDVFPLVPRQLGKNYFLQINIYVWYVYEVAKM